MNNQTDSLCAVLNTTIGKVSPRGAHFVHLIMETLLREHPEVGCQLLFSRGIVQTLLVSCGANTNNSKSCEPDRVIALHLTVLSRLLIATPTLLKQLSFSDGFTLTDLVSFLSSERGYVAIPASLIVSQTH